MTKQELILKLKEIQSNHPNTEVTRKTFRKESDVKDSVWEKQFGSFAEFKVAAGLAQTKVAKKLQSAVTRHASVEHLKEFNTQKAGWEDAYLKPSGERFQTILTGSDIHDKLCDPFYRRTFIHTAYRVQPQKIVLAGDVFDLYEFSKYNKDIRKVNILSAIEWVHKFLEDLRNAAPDAELIMISGNHENRLLRYLSEQSPELLPILSDLHGFTISSLLGLDKYEVNFISKDSLAVFTETDLKKEVSKNFYIAYDAVLFHHFPYARTYGLPGVNGHHHTHVVHQEYNVMKGPYEWHQLGAGHIRAAEYCEAQKWTNGFALIHVDTQTKATQIEYFDVTNNHAVIGGRWYQRIESELIVAG